MNTDRTAGVSPATPDNGGRDACGTPNAHLTGPVLEALAAGEPAEMPGLYVQGHLQSCAQCRAALEAMQQENAMFAAELSKTETSAAAGGNTAARVTALRTHKPFFYYAVAALLMVAVAVKFVWNDTPSPKLASKGDVKQTFGDDKDKPKDDKAVPDGSVYEGKSATEWVEDLKKLEPGRLIVDGGASEQATKAIEALTELGPDSIAAVFAWASNDAERREAAIIIGRRVTDGLQQQPLFTQQQLSASLQKQIYKQLSQLLMDSNFAVRRAAVELLGSFGGNNAFGNTGNAYTVQVRSLLTGALNDRDRAVVKAAREALANMPDPAADAKDDAELDALVKTYTAQVEKAELDAAQKTLALLQANRRASAEQVKEYTDRLAKLMDKDTHAQGLLKKAQDLIASKNYMEALLAAREARQLAPNNPVAMLLLQRIQEAIASAENASASSSSSRPSNSSSSTSTSTSSSGRPKSPAPIGDFDPFDETPVSKSSSSSSAAPGGTSTSTTTTSSGRTQVQSGAVGETLEFENATATQAAAIITKRWGVKVYPGTAKGTVTLKLKNPTLEEAVQEVAKQLGAKLSKSLNTGTYKFVVDGNLTHEDEPAPKTDKPKKKGVGEQDVFEDAPAKPATEKPAADKAKAKAKSVGEQNLCE